MQPYRYPESTQAANNMVANIGQTYRYSEGTVATCNMAAGMRHRFQCPENVAPSPLMASPVQPYGAVKLDYYYPHLQVGALEPVVVTQVSDPHRLFCQLRSLSHEVQRLSESMHHYYEAQKAYGEQESSLSLVQGQPCASCGVDGRWYRSFLQELVLDKNLAMVIHVDWGRRELIPLNRLRNLAAEYLRMPVVTFPCALYGITDAGLGWHPMLIAELRTLLLGRHVHAKIECYNSYEHLYVITLLAEDGVNLNGYVGMRLQSPKVCQVEMSGTAELPSVTEDNVEKIPLQAPYVSKYPPVELKIGKFEDAVVEFIIDPFNFWIRLEKYAADLEEMVDGMTTLYANASKLEGIITKPKTGQLCCASYQDLYHRAEVISVEKNKNVTVYFLDNGIIETVEWFHIKDLPSEFTRLPGLANKCCIADTYPLEDTWSQEATLAFKVAITDKKLVIHVVSIDADEYTIEVTDQSRIEEKSVGKILAKTGLARFEELDSVDSQSNGETIAHVKSAKTVLNPAASDYVSKVQETATSHPSEESKEVLHLNPFEEQLFEPGANIEIVVSHVDHPGNFWCQNPGSKAELNNLMADIQQHCSSTNCPYSSSSLACLARCKADGKWYRAFISEIPENTSKTSVEVLYVDYGNRETVPVTNLRALNSEFFHLKAQAFKCSLYNIITPTGGNPFIWDDKATKVFMDFVQKASKRTEFHCIFYANALLDQEVFNIVDLCTPFDSVCDVLVRSGYATHLRHKTMAPSVQLCSYYYSMHDIKNGSEEKICITHVDSSLLFYAQLNRSTRTLSKIESTIAKVIDKTRKVKLPPVNGALCLAKFEDQQWYRGLIQLKNGSKEILFVDYGNTEKLLEEDLLPITSSEHDLFLLPMQAIKCYLPDIPPKVPSKIVSWFEEAVLGKTLKAVIVSKDADGKLSVELYDGNHQINATLKSKLGLRVPEHKSDHPGAERPKTFKPDDSRKLYVNPSNQERRSIFSEGKDTKNTDSDRLADVQAKTFKQNDSRKLPDNAGNQEKKTQLFERNNFKCREADDPPAVQSKTFKQGDSRKLPDYANQESKPSFSEGKNYNCRESDNRSYSDMDQEPESRSRKHPTSQHKTENRDYNSHFQEFDSQRKTKTFQTFSSNGSYQQSLAGRDARPGGNRTLPQRQSSTFEAKPPAKTPVMMLSDIPPRKISPGIKESVYVSHTNSVFDFYVQVADDSDKLEEISGILNDDKGTYEDLADDDIYVGNVICAKFPDDGLYYRGVVTEKTRQILRIEYIDYGNTSEISDCKNFRLPQKCCPTPALSIRCSLSKPKNASSAPNLQEILLVFLERTKDVQLDCEFLKQDGVKWDVILRDELGSINDLLIESKEPVLEKNIKEPRDMVINMKIVKEEKTSSVSVFTWSLPQLGATVKVFASSADSPECFWCQLSMADVDSLASQVQEAGEQSIENEDFIGGLKIGSPCNVIFSEDNNWYRAMVTKMEADLVTVRFIDYGNEDCVGRDQIRQLPEPLVKIHPQAFSCCLADFDLKEGTWSAEGKDYFYEKVTEDVLELTICGIQESSLCHIPLACVTLKYNKLNINEEMRKFWQEVQNMDLELPEESTGLSLVMEADKPHTHRDILTADLGQCEECVCLSGEDRPLQKDAIGDVCRHHGEEQEIDTERVKVTTDLHSEVHVDVAVEVLDHAVLKGRASREELGSYEVDNDQGEEMSPYPPAPSQREQGVTFESGHAEIAADYQFSDLQSSRQQEVTTPSEIIEETDEVPGADAAEEHCTEDETERENEANEGTNVPTENLLTTNDIESEETLQSDNEEMETAASSEVDVTSDDYVESENLLTTKDIENEETLQSDNEEMEEAASSKVYVTSDDYVESENLLTTEDLESEETLWSNNEEMEEAASSEVDVTSDNYVESENLLTTKDIESEETLQNDNEEMEKAASSEVDVSSDNYMERENLLTTEDIENEETLQSDNEEMEEAASSKVNVTSDDYVESENLLTTKDIESEETLWSNNEKMEEAASSEVDVTSDNYVESENLLTTKDIESEETLQNDNEEMEKAASSEVDVSSDNYMESENLLTTEDIEKENEETLQSDNEEMEEAASSEVNVSSDNYVESENHLTTKDIESEETLWSNNKEMEEAASSEVNVTSEGLKESENTLESKALEINSFGASEDLDKIVEVVLGIVPKEDQGADKIGPSVIRHVHKIKKIVTNEDVEGSEDLVIAGEAAPNIVLEECEAVETIKFAGKIEPSVIRDVYKIENIVTNEDVEESEDLVKVGKAASSIVLEEGEVVENIEFAEEIEPSMIRDVHKIEYIVTNEDVEESEDLVKFGEAVLSIVLEEGEVVENIEFVEEIELSMIRDVHKIENIVTNEEVEGSEDLARVGEAVPSIVLEEGEVVENIEFAEEIEPSMIRDVHKIEYIVTNEDVEGSEDLVKVGEAVPSIVLEEGEVVENIEFVEEIEPSMIRDVHKIEYIVTNEDVEGSEDLVKVGEAVPSIVLEEGEVVENIEFAEEIEPSMIRDVHKIEYIVTNEDVEGSEDLDKVGEAVPSIVLEEGEVVKTIEFVEEIELSMIRDVHKIENIVNNEDVERSEDLDKVGEAAPSIVPEEGEVVETIEFAEEIELSKIVEGVEGSDAVVDVEFNEQSKESMASEEDIIDVKVYAEPIEIEPEEDVLVLQGDAFKEDVESYGGLVICDDVTIEDVLGLGDADRLRSEYPLDSVSVTEGGWDPPSEDCTETVRAEDFSGNEETGCGEISTEHLGSITSNNFVQIGDGLTICNISECGGVTNFEDVIQEEEDIVSPETAIEEFSTSFEEFEATIIEGPLTVLSQDFLAGANEEPTVDEDYGNHKDVEAKKDLETEAAAFEEVFCEILSTDDINDHEESELVQVVIEGSQHDVDCEKDVYDQNEDTCLADDTDTRQETDQAHAAPEVEAEDMWGPTAEDDTSERDGDRPDSFTIYRECPTLIASTDSVYESEPPEKTDSESEGPGSSTEDLFWSFFCESKFVAEENVDTEDTGEGGDSPVQEDTCQAEHCDTEDPQGQAPAPRVSSSVDAAPSPVPAVAAEESGRGGTKLIPKP